MPEDTVGPDGSEEEEDDGGGGLFGGGDDSDSGGDCGFLDIKCYAVESFSAMLSMIYEEFIKTGIEEVADAVVKTAFGLPAPEGEIVARYEALVDKVKPAILVGILLLGLSMMLESANFNVAYATQEGLPKLVFTAAALVYFPEFMEMVSELSGAIAVGFMDEATLGSALKDMLLASLTSGGPVVFLLVVSQIVILLMGLLVMAASYFVHILFYILFIAGPLALILYPVPGFSQLTGSWFRGIVACTAIPLLFSLEVMIGSWIVASPEMIFGAEARGLASIFGAIVILWIMWKTPFKVMEWAFHSYSAPKGGLMKGLVIGAGGRAIAGVLTGGAGGAAAGGAAKAAKDAPKMDGARQTRMIFASQQGKLLGGRQRSDLGVRHAAGQDKFDKENP